MGAECFNVFTYGSLMYSPVWQRVVSGSYQSSDATIRGFRRLCVRDEAYPVLVVANSAPPICGRLYHDVTAADIERLDAFETDAYVRVAVAATTKVGPLVAQAYLGRHHKELVDIDWSPKNFEVTGMQSFLTSYVQAHTAKNETRP